MTWIPLLLASPSPTLRYLVFRDLLENPDEQEMQELKNLQKKDPLVTTLLDLQNTNGSWPQTEIVGLTQATPLHNTSQALARLGYYGLDESHPAVERGAHYIFSQQLEDGSWPPPESIGRKKKNRGKSVSSQGFSSQNVITPLQTTLPLRGLAMCGYATDNRAEKAYEWLSKNRLPDGAWPTRITEDGSYGYLAGYRALPHSRWGCRSNTTGAVQCLAFHPHRNHSPEARRALDLLLARETQEAHVLGFESARMAGIEAASGFLTFFARFDGGLLLDLCWRIGATRDDTRVSTLISFVRELQGPFGLWEYENPQANRWITFDLLRSLSRIDEKGDWITEEPSTPFQGYKRIQKRY
jgi:hypothetical protein